MRKEIVLKLTELRQKSQTPLGLILHEDNLRHLANLVRALRTPGGNALILTRYQMEAEVLTRLAFSITGVRTMEMGQNFSGSFKHAMHYAGSGKGETGFIISQEMA